MASASKISESIESAGVSASIAQAVQKAVVSPMGGIVSGLDPAWNLVISSLRKSAEDFGFTSVELGPLSDASIYEKLKLPEVEESFTLAYGGKKFSPRLSVLVDLLRLYYTTSANRQNFIRRWFTLAPFVTVGEKGGLTTSWQAVFWVSGEHLEVAQAQVLCALWKTIRLLELKDTQLEVNSIGDVQTQKAYGEVLEEFLKPKKYSLCDACAERLKVRPFEILRCDQLGCQTLLVDGPVVLDHLSQSAQGELTAYLEALEEMSLEYQLNPFFASSDMATGLCLGVKTRVGDKACVLAQGFHTDLLSAQVSGKGSRGFALLCDLNTMWRSASENLPKKSFEVHLVPLGELAVRRSMGLFNELVSAGVSVCDDFGSSGVKNQLKSAQDSKSKIALIIGQREATDNQVILRDVLSGLQEVFSREHVVEEVLKRLGR